MHYWYNFLLYYVSVAESLNILFLFPYNGKSHVDVFLPLTKALANRGHHITVISHLVFENSNENYTNIVLSLENLIEVKEIGEYEQDIFSLCLVPLLMEKSAKARCSKTLKDKPLKKFLSQEMKFDVVLMEYFTSDCFAGIVNKVKAPVIGLSSTTILPWLNSRFGNPSNPAYIPHNLLCFSDKMNFFERLINFVVQAVHEIFYLHRMMNNDYNIAQRHFQDLPQLWNIVSKSSLFLVNSHFSINFPRPLVPAIVEVGGIHIIKVKQLPNVSIFFLFLLNYCTLMLCRRTIFNKSATSINTKIVHLYKHFLLK